MADFFIPIKRPVATVVSSGNVEVVWVPEPFEVVQEREINRRVNQAVKEKLERLFQEKLNELQPKIRQEKEAEYRHGYEDGERAGRADEQEKLRRVKEDLTHIIKENIECKEKLLKEAESTIVKMAFAFAKQLVGEAVQIQPEIVQNHVKKALEFILDESKLIFRVNPEDIARFDKKEEFIHEGLLKKVEVIPDESVSRGGCILETNAGIIDATIESQIVEMAKALRNGIEREGTLNA